MYQANDRFMVRIPTAEKTEIKYTEEEVSALCKDKAFREKIKVASPSLLEMMDFYENSPDKLSQKKRNEFLNSMIKYYIRSQKRTTPFGLFSSVGIGKFVGEKQLDESRMQFDASQEQLDASQELLDVSQVQSDANQEQSDECKMQFRKKVHIDTEWLYGYIVTLENSYYRQLQFKINNVCYQNGNRVVLLYSTEKDVAEISVRFTKVFEIVEAFCRQYKSYKDIFREIQRQYPAVEEDTIKNYLLELIQKQILISNLRPSFTSRNQLQDLKNQCERCGLTEETDALEQIKRLCQEYEATIIGEGTEQYHSIVEAMKAVYQSKYYLQVDTILCESGFRLSTAVKRSVEHLATFLVTTSSVSKNSYAFLERYRNRFIEKYGFQREVPVLELLDSAIGLGAPDGYCCPASDFYVEPVREAEMPTKTKNYFMDKYEEALRNHTSICLDMDSLKVALDLQEPETAPLSFEMYFMVQEKEGKTQLCLGDNGGSMCAGKTFGRFAAESQEIEETLLQINQKEQELLCDNTETCEISYLPTEPRSGNVVRCITGREKCLTGYTGSQAQDAEIRLEDILIGATEKQFYARNAKTGNYLVFGSNNMYNIMLQPNVFRFLLEIANDGKTVWCDYPWKYTYLPCRHIPQIEFEGIVLSNEQWYINRTELGLGAEEKSFPAFKQALLSYMETREIPKKICLVDNDNRIYLDLKEELAVRILFDEWKKKGEDSILLERTEEGDSPVFQKAGAHPTEIVVPVFRRQKDSFLCQNTVNRFLDREQHIVFPYENWLYLKLYCRKDREEELIAFKIRELGEELQQKLQIEHFFMRYMDPKPHIRLRFYGEPALLMQATPVIMAWVRELERQRIIGDMNICTYEKEIERYGGAGLMPFAEKLFRVDSVIVEEILCRKRLKQLDMDELEIAVASVLFYVCRFYDGFWEQLSYLTRNHHDGSYRNEFKEKKDKLLTLFDLENGWEHFQSREEGKVFFSLSEQRNPWIDDYKEQIKQENTREEFKDNIVNSVLHLHCNRLLGTNRELERKVMALAESILYAKKFLFKKED